MCDISTNELPLINYMKIDHDQSLETMTAGSHFPLFPLKWGHFSPQWRPLLYFLLTLMLIFTFRPQHPHVFAEQTALTEVTLWWTLVFNIKGKRQKATCTQSHHVSDTKHELYCEIFHNTSQMPSQWTNSGIIQIIVMMLVVSGMCGNEMGKIKRTLIVQMKLLYTWHC